MSYAGEYDAGEYPDGANAPRYGYRGAAALAAKDEELRALRETLVRKDAEIETLRAEGGVHPDLVAALRLDLEELRVEHAEALATIRGHRRDQAALAAAPEGEIIGAEFQPEDVTDGRIVVRVAVPASTRVARLAVRVVGL